MNKLLITAGFAISAALISPAGAQTGAAVVGTAPGMAGAAQTVSIMATITAVDKKTRDITLKGPQGNEVTFTG